LLRHDAYGALIVHDRMLGFSLIATASALRTDESMPIPRLEREVKLGEGGLSERSSTVVSSTERAVA
jgi:hypothetical protein